MKLYETTVQLRNSGSVLRGVNHGDVRINLDGLAVENRRPVAPLTDRFLRGKVEKWIACNNLERLNCAVCADDGTQFHTAFSMCLSCERGVHRLDAVNEHRRIETRHAHDLCS